MFILGGGGVPKFDLYKDYFKLNTNHLFLSKFQNEAGIIGAAPCSARIKAKINGRKI